MVTWAMVLETAIKWLIPVLCVAIVGLITAHFVKPFRKGNDVKRQAEWDERFNASQEPKKMGDRELEIMKKELTETVTKADEEILKQIKDVSDNIKDQREKNKIYHDKVDKSMNLIQEGVRDAHLQNLIATCETYIKRGYITSTELDAYQSRFNLYKKLGGNGHMEPWDSAIKRLPHEPSQKHTSTASTINPVNTPPITRK